MRNEDVVSAVEELAVRLGPKAEKLAPGVTLCTRDGTAIGNAIVVKEVPPHPSAAEYLTQTGQKMWLIVTDFGNHTQFTDREIEEYFTLGVQDSFQRWAFARYDLLTKTKVV